MVKKEKHNIEIKIKACEDYESGNGTFSSIAEVLGVNKSTTRQWYLRYKEHGSSALERLDSNRSYSKEFKALVIEEYLSGESSIRTLAIKYNMVHSIIRNWLKKWYNGIEIDDYVPKGDVYTMKSRLTTFQDRLEIVNWVIDNNMSYKDAADRYSINYALVYKWTRAYIKGGPESITYKKRGPKSRSEMDEANLTEVDKLKLELEKEKVLRKNREFEIEVLKKKEEFEQQLQSQKYDKNQNMKL